ncbi:MAG: putative transporter [Deltaproteobacteria bacterium]|jgi:putative transport protein|nr:putative transporter [Deltaproteobacteria bacterium]
MLFSLHGPAEALVILSLAVIAGLLLGAIQVRGVRLGVGGVLFSGLAFGHFGLKLSPQLLEFVREFGLILFVYSIGMQVGPGFMDSLRRKGLRLNLVAAGIVLAGGVVTLGIFRLSGLSVPAAVGLFSGAVTNTPSLAAATHVFTEIMPDAAPAVAEAGLAYALAYPFGIIGIILMMLLVRALFHIDPARELQELEAQEHAQHPPLEGMSFEIDNPGVYGVRLGDLPDFSAMQVVFSRVLEEGKVSAPTPDTRLKAGMLVHAVGSPADLARLKVLVGKASATDLTKLSGPLARRNLLVTKPLAAGKHVRTLGLEAAHGITITRISRAGTEFTPGPGVRLHLGDKLRCVGQEADLDRAEHIVGNSAKELDHPHVAPLFLGILLGTLLGSIPVLVPGLPSGLKLGLAGGPLLVAIILSRIHHFGGMTWYLPVSANLMLREIGIGLFLASVGLGAGERFLAAILDGSGLYWMALGMCITFVPLLVAALAGRIFLHCNYASSCGLLAGSMTDPPALAFAVQMLGSDAPASVYATVYPLTMILRILCGQLLVLVMYAMQ